MVLFNGENTTVINGKITSFSFSKSEFNLSSFTTNIILVKKTQEHRTAELILCVKSLTNNKNDTEEIKKKLEIVN